ncbi:MAG: putative bifunctional diguanylate cyclase/phosphodiesterase [Sulfuricella sp.]
MDRTLLLVDDEDNITAALVRLLRQDGYQVLTANSARSALDILEKHTAGVVLTDQRMPEMSGVELLSEIKELYPDTVRMVLSGHADLESVTEAVNRGAVYKYLTKPWDNAMLRANVHEAFRHYDLVQERARLAREIQAANEELSHINLELEALVAQKDSHIERIAHYDPVTNLPNRLLLCDRLKQAMVHAQRDDKLVAVMAMDLDRFKIINDTFGHPVGDRLLHAVAERLANHVREGDTVARMGGDEFTFVLTDLDDSHHAGDVARKILRSLADAPFTLEDKEIFISSSMGISVYPWDGHDTTTLVKNADAALYHAKGEGRNNFQYYAREMNASAMQRLTLENALRRALEREEFLLYYQPQVDLASGRIIGMESLLRWQHPERGLVAPGEFIPLLEETGLIVPVGEWVLHTACRQGCAWQQLGFPPMRIAVNLSALQFRQPDLVGMVARILAETGLDPGSQELEFELTESLLMKNVEETSATLHRLHEMGVKLSIDDFGTGYSSLSYLKRFPLNSLKIDQSFVRDLSSNPDDAAIVSAIIALGHGLKLSVIAEGVETAGQLAYLREMKCDEMQGFLFSRPVPASEITQLLHEGKLLNLVV